MCRFKAKEGRKVHESDSCLVIIVDDVKLKLRVALKLMANEEQWRRELSLRQTEGGAVLDGSHIISILDSLIDENAKSLSSAFPFILVMPAAEQDLSDFLSHSRMAGSDLEAVVDIMFQVATHLQYFHSACGSIHGDVKARFSLPPLCSAHSDSVHHCHRSLTKWHWHVHSTRMIGCVHYFCRALA